MLPSTSLLDNLLFTLMAHQTSGPKGVRKPPLLV
jgi:hypothetical protein